MAKVIEGKSVEFKINGETFGVSESLPQLSIGNAPEVYTIDFGAHAKMEVIQKIHFDVLLDEATGLRKALDLIMAQCGIPDASEACRQIMKTAKGALE